MVDFSKNSLLKSNKTTVVLVAFSLVCYFLLAYKVPRTEFWQTAGLYGLLFGGYLLFNLQQLSWKLILGIGVGIRFLFLFALPELSDDFYRFYWDGLQSIHGISPFAYLPTEITNEVLAPIYSKLNSPSYYSVYPGFNQLIYAFCAYLGQSLAGFVLVLKLLFLTTELLSFYFLYRLLQFKNKPLHLLSWYFLHPLVVLEFVGNLHFEGFMLTAFLGSLYCFYQNKFTLSSLSLGLACAIKIMPFLFVPLYFVASRRKSFLVLPLFVFVVALLPFYHQEMLPHILESVQLYFGEFEFNSSLYLLFKWIGIPKIFLKVLLLGSLVLISWQVYRQKVSLEIGLVWLFTLYLFFSQSIHPWYVAGFLGVAVLHQQRYVFLWSFFIFFTYITYQTTDYQQQVWVNVIEYLLVGAWFLFGLIGNKVKR